MVFRGKNTLWIVSHNTLASYWRRHPETMIPLRQWEQLVSRAEWRTMQEVANDLPGAKSLNGERARFAIAGGNYRLVVSFNFRQKIAYVKFIGTHAEYDRIDALTVHQF
jgi:mRNA interferase HigB